MYFGLRIEGSSLTISIAAPPAEPFDITAPSLVELTAPAPALPVGLVVLPPVPALAIGGVLAGVPTLPLVPAVPVCGAPVAEPPLAGAWPVVAGSFEQPTLANRAKVVAVITDVFFA
jgi:hypothetical protein